MFKKKMMGWTGRMDKGTMMIQPNNKVKGQRSGTLYRWRVQHRRDEGRRGSKKIKRKTSGRYIDTRTQQVATPLMVVLLLPGVCIE